MISAKNLATNAATNLEVSAAKDRPFESLGILAIEPSPHETAKFAEPLRTAETFARALRSSLLATSIVKPHVHAAESLYRVAREEHASYIVMITHLRSRAHFGASCTRRLSEMANLPVLAVNAEAESVEAFRRICFATDFSERSRKAFDQVLSIAALMNSELVLFHHEPLTLGHSEDSGSQEALASGWLAEAKSRGVKASVESSGQRKPTDELLLEIATQKDCQLVLVAPHSANSSAPYRDSLTARLLLNSKLPLLILNGVA